MVMTSPEAEIAFDNLERIVLGIVNEHLARNGNACLLVVKTVMKTMNRRNGTKETRELIVQIDKILDGLPISEFFDYASNSATWNYKNGKKIPIQGRRSRIYSLRRAA